MSEIKGKGQRLIPEYLLKYLEAYKENHPDPTAGGGATLDDIVDSQGNKRFIEGDLTVILDPQIQQEMGATVLYSKWSLSGTHLMLVACMSFANNFSQSPTIPAFRAVVPEWIKEKITPIFSTYAISKISVPKYPTGSLTAWLYLWNNEIEIHLESPSGAPITANSTVRYQFDLLIDSE